MEFIGELFSVPWAYRATLFMLSENYRCAMKQKWKTNSKFYVFFDIFLSIAIFLLEISLLAALAIEITIR